MKYIFEDYEFRPSGLGHILTSLKSITDKQLEELDYLLGRPKPTPNQLKKIKELEAKRDFVETPETLPDGVKTYLDEIFRTVYWRRRRILSNKYLDKGNMCEQDVLEIASLVDNEFYIKNDEKLSNGYIAGTPDNRQDGIIRDAKSNWDMDSFDKAELSSIYEWQIKGYCWLDGATEGELIYGLVNNPVHQVLAARQSLWYSMGQPEEDDLAWRRAIEQQERNMIFDINKFRDENPGYDFDNEVLDFDIPYYFRIKKFNVKLHDSDIKDMKRRIILCRKYLLNKEKEVEAKKKLHKNETK
jgi:hypothetical protein